MEVKADEKTTEEKLFQLDLAFCRQEGVNRPNRCPMKLYLIRHGESEMNLRKDLICGRSNSTPLTAKGREEAWALGKRFAAQKLSFDEVYSSTAKRARETAEITCKVMGFQCGKIVLSDEILELCQGEFTQQPREKVYTKERLKQIKKETFFFRPPGFDVTDLSSGAKPQRGESQYDVEVRISKFINKLLDAPKPQKEAVCKEIKTVAVFMHGFAIRCFLRRVIQAGKGFSNRVSISNTGITVLEYSVKEGYRGGWIIHSINDHAHLEHLEFKDILKI